MKIIILILVIVFMLAVLVVGGQFAGGFFLLQKIGLDPHTVKIDTLYVYYTAYGKETSDMAKAIKMGLAIAFAPVVLTIFVFLAAILMRKALIDRLYGEARFATKFEIQKAGMFFDEKKDSKWPPVLLGKMGKQFIADYSQEYTTLSAAPGAGKGVSFVVPNLLHYDHSAVCLDPKLENFAITSGYRKDVLGQEVYLFSPDNDSFVSHGWNPLDYISRDPRRQLAQIKNLSSILIPAEKGPNQSFFLGARNAVDGLILYLMETPTEELTMYRVNAINSDPIGIEKWIILTVANRAKSANPLSETCVMLLMSYANEHERKRETTRGIIGTYLAAFSDPLCRAATRKSDFDFNDLRKKRMTIYVGISPGNIVKFQRLLNLFFSQVIMINTVHLPEEGPKDANGDPILKYQCLMLLDEFVALGPIEIIRSSSGYTRAYNMRYAIVFQNKAQVFADECYGKAGGESLLQTFHNEVVFATESIDEAEEYSKRLGNITLKHRETSRTLSSSGSSSTRSVQRHSRALLLPQEIQRLPYSDQLLFKRGGKILPMRCSKIVWYTDPFFMAKANLPTPKIPDMVFQY